MTSSLLLLLIDAEDASCREYPVLQSQKSRLSQISFGLPR
jgi:hypothetical protein